MTWAFEFENQPYFAGFRALATNGIDLPVLNVFRMMARMSGQRLAVQSSGGQDLASILAHGVRGEADVSAAASLDAKHLAVIVWHYHDDDLPGPDAAVDLEISGLPQAWSLARVEQFRVDANHSNSFAAWKQMGSPQPPTPEQQAALESAGHLAQLNDPQIVQLAGRSISLHLDLPRQGVSLLIFERKPAP